MKRLATLAILSFSGAAAAHPGHEHIGIAPTHHLSSLGLVIASLLAAGAGYAIFRILRANAGE